MRHEAEKDFRLLTLFIVWMMTVSIGLGFFLRYKSTAGDIHNFVKKASTSPDSDMQALLISVEPRCYCARNALANLEKIAAVNQAKTHPGTIFERLAAIESAMDLNGLQQNTSYHAADRLTIDWECQSSLNNNKCAPAIAGRDY